MCLVRAHIPITNRKRFVCLWLCVGTNTLKNQTELDYSFRTIILQSSASLLQTSQNIQKKKKKL